VKQQITLIYFLLVLKNLDNFCKGLVLNYLRQVCRKNTFIKNRSITNEILPNLRFSPYFYILKKWSILLFPGNLHVLSLYQKLIDVATGINQTSNIQLKTESIQIPFENL